MDNCLFTNFYKKCYKDVSNLTDKEIKKHWKTIGIKEGRLPNKIIFEQTFPNFNVKEWVRTNFKYIFESKYEIYGWIYLKNKKNYENYLLANNFVLDYNNNKKNDESDESDESDEYNKSNTSNNLTLIDIISNHGIKKLYVSEELKHFADRFKKKFNLEKYDKNKDIGLPTIFFGIYDQYDFKEIVEHKGIKFLIWGGTDCDDRYKIRKKSIYVIKKISNLSHIAISEWVKTRLDKYQIPNQLINFSLVNKNIFKPVDILGDSIYINNGLKKGDEFIYGESIYKKVIEELSDFNFIYSNDLNKSWESIPEVYSKCFIGLRLTDGDGNANTVQEFNSMNIPIIFNGPGGIGWKSHEDIIKTINDYNSKRKKIENLDDRLNLNKNLIFYYIETIDSFDNLNTDLMNSTSIKLDSIIVIIYKNILNNLDIHEYDESLLIQEDLLDNLDNNYFKNCYNEPIDLNIIYVTNYKLPYILKEFIEFNNFIYVSNNDNFIKIKNIKVLLKNNYNKKNINEDIIIYNNINENNFVKTDDIYLNYLIDKKILDNIIVII